MSNYLIFSTSLTIFELLTLIDIMMLKKTLKDYLKTANKTSINNNSRILQDNFMLNQNCIKNQERRYIKGTFYLLITVEFLKRVCIRSIYIPDEYIIIRFTGQKLFFQDSIYKTEKNSIPNKACIYSNFIHIKCSPTKDNT